MTDERARVEHTPQLNSVRSEYVGGDLDDTELEIQVEQALAEGPTIGHSHRQPKPPQGYAAFASTVSGVFIRPLLALKSWRTDDTDYKYDWTRHQITAVQHDPGPNDHPAERAGTAQTATNRFPVMISAMLALTAVGTGWPLLGGLLTCIQLVAMKAPKPAVDYTVRGFGRHVALDGAEENR